MGNKCTGTVKFFKRQEAYGMIEGSEIGEDVFVRHSQIEPDRPGFKMLYKGDEVSFEAVQTPKGWQAHNVRRT